MKKTVVNVYKNETLWIKPPPGLGDYIRGCCYLKERALTAPPDSRFDVCFNLDLAPASKHLDYQGVYCAAPADALVGAAEFFARDRDGDVDQAIDDFLASGQNTLFISTNRSWRGTDDMPSRAAVDHVRKILVFTPSFDAVMEQRLARLPHRFALLAIRDCNEEVGRRLWRWRSRAFLKRIEAFIQVAVEGKKPTGCDIVCISNNAWLRDLLCKRYGYVNFQTNVINRGGDGIFSEAELQDATLIKKAEIVFSLSRYPWNSGFSVWLSRLYGVPAVFGNAQSNF